MNWSRIASPEAWKGLALEAVWKFTAHSKSTTGNPTWPLDPQDRANMRVKWPSRYGWSPATKWVEPLRHGLAKHVTTELADVPQPFEGIVMIQVMVRGIRHNVAIDYSDLPNINESCARTCPLYFKMQFSVLGYPFSNVFPGGFVSNSETIYQYLSRIRAIADKNSRSYDVYGRFGLDFGAVIRRRACSLLAEQDSFRWQGGLQIKRYSLALLEIARSKICIDLPGKGDFCFRLIDYLAVGTCIIGLKHRTVLHVPLVDREHIVYVKEDLSDLVDLCRFYLKDDTARQALHRNSRSFFDKYLHRDQLAAYYLRCCLDRLS